MNLTETQQRALGRAREVLAEEQAAALIFHDLRTAEWYAEMRRALRDVAAAFEDEDAS